jgi:hypothetical protein
MRRLCTIQFCRYIMLLEVVLYVMQGLRQFPQFIPLGLPTHS